MVSAYEECDLDILSVDSDELLTAAKSDPLAEKNWFNWVMKHETKFRFLYYHEKDSVRRKWNTVDMNYNTKLAGMTWGVCREYAMKDVEMSDATKIYSRDKKPDGHEQTWKDIKDLCTVKHASYEQDDWFVSLLS